MTRNEIERTLRRCMNGRGWKDELTEGMLDFWVQTLRTVSNSAGVPAIEQVMASVRSWGVASPGAVLKVARQRTEGERGSRPAVVSCDICGGAGELSFYAHIVDSSYRDKRHVCDLMTPYQFQQFLRGGGDGRGWYSFSVGCECENTATWRGNEPPELRKAVTELYQRNPVPGMTREEFRAALELRWPSRKAKEKPVELREALPTVENTSDVWPTGRE